MWSVSRPAHSLFGKETTGYFQLRGSSFFVESKTLFMKLFAPFGGRWIIQSVKTAPLVRPALTQLYNAVCCIQNAGSSGYSTSQKSETKVTLPFADMLLTIWN